jgi:hypothetical protein
MRFKIEETGKYEWFNGQILEFDPKTGKYILWRIFPFGWSDSLY